MHRNLITLWYSTSLKAYAYYIGTMRISPLLHTEQEFLDFGRKYDEELYQIGVGDLESEEIKTILQKLRGTDDEPM